MGSGHEAVQIQTGFSQCTLNCVYSQTIFINTKFCGHSNRLACFSSIQLINLHDAVPNKSFYLPGYASIMANLTCVHILHMTRKVYVMPPSSCGKWRFMGSSSGSAVSCLQPPQQQWKQKTHHSLPYHPTVYRFISLLFIPPAVLIFFLSAG